MSTFHIDGLEGMTFYQQAAIWRRCPVCGKIDRVLVFATLAGTAKETPPESRVENMRFPDVDPAEPRKPSPGGHAQDRKGGFFAPEPEGAP
jgi:hypothetical protein